MIENSKVRSTHTRRAAIVYIRQSYPSQVENNRESTARQYALVEKATALGYSILLNRPFYDGNKRMAHYALATFLKLNGTDIFARVDEQEKVVRALAAGMMDPKHFLAWLRQNSTSATAK